MSQHVPAPTIDQVRSIESLLIFDATHPLHIITVPQADDAELVDVHISLHGERSPYFTITGVPFFCPSDVHVYFLPSDRPIADALDITPYLISSLRKNLQEADASMFRGAFRSALETLLAIESAPPLESAVNPQHIATDRAAIPSLVAAPLATLLDALGNRNVGVGGSLHLFNWLFGYVPLAPLSLASILAAVDTPPYSLALSGQIRPRLLLCHGRISDISSPNAAAAGAVRIVLEASYHNPLADEFDVLERKIRVALVDLQKKFRAGEPLMQALSRIDDSTAHVETTLAVLTSLVGGAQSEITALRAETAEVAARLGSTRSRIFPFLGGSQ
jgi:hypothetical protein